MSRKNKPFVLHQLAGTVRKSQNHDEPQPERDLRIPPEWMTPEQKKVWNDHVDYCPPGMLGSPDGGTLANYCLAVVERDTLVIKVRELPDRVITTTKGNMIQHPYIGMLNRQILLMTKLASELGFSPTSRTRLRVPKGGSAKSNPFSEHTPRSNAA